LLNDFIVFIILSEFDLFVIFPFSDLKELVEELTVKPKEVKASRKINFEKFI